MPERFKNVRPRDVLLGTSNKLAIHGATGIPDDLFTAPKRRQLGELRRVPHRPELKQHPDRYRSAQALLEMDTLWLGLPSPRRYSQSLQ
jgi:hypothetical protein